MRYENGGWHFYRFSVNKQQLVELADNTESKQELMKYIA